MQRADIDLCLVMAFQVSASGQASNMTGSVVTASVQSGSTPTPSSSQILSRKRELFLSALLGSGIVLLS